ncbi:DUF3189 family protein [Calditerricola satsumensis]|uniref:DUF3189 family protein n=1 Tax=Calditerricola satsumensis TaxID=373054 RepID=A0A8J3F9R6_9BACI|nr:DUF3189 family protein [Calditerricola satsumensis]GGJ94027.1 hypothetical protein GCM10007043_04740 [Calditerricola satsumensis]
MWTKRPRNVVYYCYGSAHSSVVAAAIHLGVLPDNRVPTPTEILSLDDFDRTSTPFIGTLYCRGRDELGCRVYTLGVGGEPALVVESFLSMVEACGDSRSAFWLVDALPHLSPIAKVGGMLSRRFGMVGVGRRIAVWGVRHRYAHLVRFVHEVKATLRQLPV